MGGWFSLTCAGCAALFLLAQCWLAASFKATEAEQQRRCRPVGVILLIPALGLMVGGVLLLDRPVQAAGVQAAIGVLLSTLLIVWQMLRLRARWGNQTPAGRFTRQTLMAAQAAPLSLIVVLALSLTGADGDGALSCMSVELFGVAALCVAANMILVSGCGYCSTADSLRRVRELYTRHRLLFTRASILKDALLVAGKAIISLVSVSFFMFVNALYSAGMGVARFVALSMHSQDRKTQIRSYRLVGIIITLASACYVLYSVRLFFGGKTGGYSMNAALVIALYTFVEFGINIRDALRLRKSRALEAKALKAISFSATLLCFVLTQTAIMSFAAEGDNSTANALSGVVFGGLAALRGVFVMADSAWQGHAEAE